MPFRRKPAAPSLHPTRLVVGLGNPGAEYKGTRHNIGFEVVEAVARAAKAALKTMRHRAQFGFALLGDTPVALVKPLTYMNLSGDAVRELARHYGIAPVSVLVISDDLDLPVGKVRMRLEGSSGGHNGHKSLVQALATNVYPRIRVGIGKSENPTIDHVLTRFRPDERKDIDEAIEVCISAIYAWAEQGPDEAMRIANAPRI